MKVGGGLNFVTGPMGAGKTLYGVRGIVRAVCNGRYCVTNIELRDGWAAKVARHVAPFASEDKRRRIADRLLGFYVYETSLDEARRYRLPGAGEGRGRFDWDEGHNDLNNRKWKDDGRAELLEWATQLRKLGYVGFLYTQHGDNTDAALRRVSNHQVKLQNQREQTRLLGVRITPIPLFLAVWYPTHLAQGNARVPPVRTERYFLSWHRNLYDTMSLYHGLSVVDELAGPPPILLPAGGRRDESSAAALPRAARSRVAELDVAGDGETAPEHPVALTASPGAPMGTHGSDGGNAAPTPGEAAGQRAGSGFRRPLARPSFRKG